MERYGLNTLPILYLYVMPAIEKLVDICMEFAMQQLEKHKEFYPFAFALARDSETIIPLAEYSREEMPPSQDVIDGLEEGFNNYYPEHLFSAVSICVDVKAVHPVLGVKMDMIEIRLDSIYDIASNLYFPYKWDNNQLDILEPYRTLGSFEFYRKQYGITDDDLNTAVFTIKDIADKNKPVLLVVHDGSGEWQFLSGEDVSEGDLMMVSVEQMLSIDKTIIQVLDMGEGFEAFREKITDEWAISLSPQQN